jgi:PAS domain-containing protein
LALQDKNEEYAVVNEELRSTTEELQIQNEALNAKDQKLQENERRLTQAEKVARIGNWILQLDTMTMLASDGADEIYGVDFRKASLAEVQKIPLPEYRPALDKSLSDLVAGVAPYDLEFRIRRPENGLIISITVHDDGAGIPDSVSMDDSKGFGFHLVRELTKQLEGTIRIERGNGTSVVLEFSV